MQGGPGGGGGRNRILQAERNTLGAPDVVGNVEIVPNAARSELEDIASGAAGMLLVSNEGGRRDSADKGQEGGRSGGGEGSNQREGGGIRKVKL